LAYPGVDVTHRTTISQSQFASCQSWFSLSFCDVLFVFTCIVCSTCVSFGYWFLFSLTVYFLFNVVLLSFSVIINDGDDDDDDDDDDDKIYKTTAGKTRVTMTITSQRKTANTSLSCTRKFPVSSFARSQYPTVVYMTFFPNGEIRKFFPGFDGTLSIQYHELKLINIVLSYTMPWPNINNLTKYCVIVHG